MLQVPGRRRPKSQSTPDFDRALNRALAPTAVSAETRGPALMQIVRIPLEKLHPHKSNRKISHDDVEELAANIAEHGQREPIRVRPLEDPIGHYEIVSGGRRYAAALKLDLPSLAAIVESHTDPASLIELAIANSHRQDLNAVERAELLTKLIAATADGGAGMDRAAAGRIFGLNADSSVRNALRILELPQFWRSQLAARKMPESLARALVPYAGPVLDDFTKHIESTKGTLRGELIELMSRDVAAGGKNWHLDQWLRTHVRPMDDAKYYHGYQVGDWPVLFNFHQLPAAKQSALRVCEIAGDKDQSKRLVALNTKLWDKLQAPLAKAAAAKMRAGKSPSEKPASKPKALTPAELKARAKAADEQLDKYSKDWMRRALRCSLAAIALSKPVSVLPVLPWLLAEQQAGSQFRGPSLKMLLHWEIPEVSHKFVDCQADARAWSGHCELEGYVPVYARLWQLLLWPVSAHSREGTHHPDLAAAGTLPDNLPPILHPVVDQLAALFHVSIASVWKLASREIAQRQLVREWLTRHTATQLDALADELKVADLPQGKRDERVQHILASHMPGKLLPLPSRLSRLVGKETKSGPKKGIL